jgi:hypothetical protein
MTAVAIHHDADPRSQRCQPRLRLVRPSRVRGGNYRACDMRMTNRNDIAACVWCGAAAHFSGPTTRAAVPVACAGHTRVLRMRMSGHFP